MLQQLRNQQKKSFFLRYYFCANKHIFALHQHQIYSRKILQLVITTDVIQIILQAECLRDVSLFKSDDLLSLYIQRLIAILSIQNISNVLREYYHTLCFHPGSKERRIVQQTYYFPCDRRELIFQANALSRFRTTSITSGQTHTRSIIRVSHKFTCKCESLFVLSARENAMLAATLLLRRNCIIMIWHDITSELEILQTMLQRRKEIENAHTNCQTIYREIIWDIQNPPCTSHIYNIFVQ